MEPSSKHHETHNQIHESHKTPNIQSEIPKTNPEKSEQKLGKGVTPRQKQQTYIAEHTKTTLPWARGSEQRAGDFGEIAEGWD